MFRRKRIKAIKRLLNRELKVELKNGSAMGWAPYAVLTDLIKDIICASQNLDDWPESDEFHDYAYGVASEMMHKVFH